MEDEIPKKMKLSDDIAHIFDHNDVVCEWLHLHNTKEQRIEFRLIFRKFAAYLNKQPEVSSSFHLLTKS